MADIGISQTRSPLRRKRPDGYVEEEPALLEQYLAPSWSWASILGRAVLFMAGTQFDHIKRFAEVLDIHIQLATHDPFGAVEGGSIALRAPFLNLGSQDLLRAPQPSSPYPVLLARIYRLLEYGGNSEYGQKHRGYVGQQFAILKLFKLRHAIVSTERICFLLLESVEGTSDWRRIESLRLTIREHAFEDSADVANSLAILEEIKRDLRKHIVRII